MVLWKNLFQSDTLALTAVILDTLYRMARKTLYYCCSTTEIYLHENKGYAHFFFHCCRLNTLNTQAMNKWLLVGWIKEWANLALLICKKGENQAQGLWGVLQKTVANAVLADKRPEKHHLPRASNQRLGNGYAPGPFWKTGPSSPPWSPGESKQNLAAVTPGARRRGGQAEGGGPGQS